MNQTLMDVHTSNGLRHPKKGESRHVTDTVDAQVYGREGLQAAVAGQIAISPRLLNLDAAAAYLSMSPWTTRDLEVKDVLPRVRVPLPGVGSCASCSLTRLTLTVSSQDGRTRRDERVRSRFGRGAGSASRFHNLIIMGGQAQRF
jgi:hypothetical protein